MVQVNNINDVAEGSSTNNNAMQSEEMDFAASSNTEDFSKMMKVMSQNENFMEG